MSKQNKSSPRLIKKYGSRRLYDTVESAYISCPQLGKIITDGFEVQVVDVKSKEDVTQQTLTSYLVENMMVLDFCSDDLLKLIIKVQGYSQEQKALVMSMLGGSFSFPPPKENP